MNIDKIALPERLNDLTDFLNIAITRPNWQSLINWEAMTADYLDITVGVPLDRTVA
jgi:hypothetical protein